MAPNRPGVYYHAGEGQLKIDTRHSSQWQGPKSVESGPFRLQPDEELVLSVFVDRSVVEVFANGRQAVMRRIYPSRPDSLGVSLFANGGSARLLGLTAWDMMPRPGVQRDSHSMETSDSTCPNSGSPVTTRAFLCRPSATAKVSA